MTIERARKFATVLAALSPILSKVPNHVGYDEERGYHLELQGFYKDGSVLIFMVEDADFHVMISGRYEILAEIHDAETLLDDVINLQADRFRYWNRVKPEFDRIDEAWLPILIEKGLAKKTESYSIS